jgi:hypothetical protein
LIQNGCITTEPTEKGKKDLDVFHPSYKIKRINKEPIKNFFDNLDDRFIDIIKNMNQQLITLKISIDKNSEKGFH